MIKQSNTIFRVTGIGISLLLVVGLIFPIAGSAAAQTPDQGEGVTPLSTLAALLSDDFNRCPPGSGVGTGWTVVKPSDTTVNLVNGFSDNAAVEIFVPSGSKHIMSEGVFSAPRILQTLATSSLDDVVDFEVETKFDSALTSGTANQVQGVVFVELNTDPATKDAIPYSHFVRFDFHTSGAELRYTVAWYNNLSLDKFQAATGTIGALSTGPLYMRIKRETKHYWTMSHSKNGTDWTPLLLETSTLPSGEVKTYSLYFDLVANQGGPFIGNTGSNPPEFTGRIDYFMNRASLISNEDELKNEIDETILGEGSIVRDPEPPNGGVYACGTDVELSANPSNGWVFRNWDGDLASEGTQNPVTVTMDGPMSVTATFVREGSQPGDLTVRGFIPFVVR